MYIYTYTRVYVHGFVTYRQYFSRLGRLCLFPLRFVGATLSSPIREEGPSAARESATRVLSPGQ